MKRTHIALLMAVILLLGCVFAAAPTAYAETPAEETPETPTEAPTDAPTEAPTDSPAEEGPEVPDFVWALLRKIIRFFKWLIPQVKPYLQ